MREESESEKRGAGGRRVGGNFSYATFCLWLMSVLFHNFLKVHIHSHGLHQVMATVRNGPIWGHTGTEGQYSEEWFNVRTHRDRGTVQ